MVPVFDMYHLYLASHMYHLHQCLFYFPPHIPDHIFWPIFLQILNKMFLFYEVDVCMLSSNTSVMCAKGLGLSLQTLCLTHQDSSRGQGGESSAVFMSLQMHAASGDEASLLSLLLSEMSLDSLSRKVGNNT